MTISYFKFQYIENDVKLGLAEATKMTPELVTFWHALRFIRRRLCKESNNVHLTSEWTLQNLWEVTETTTNEPILAKFHKSPWQNYIDPHIESLT